MGVVYTAYVGPYIKFDMPKKSVSVSRLACLNVECERYKSSVGDESFCSRCGREIKLFGYEIEESAFDLYEDFIYKYNESLVYYDIDEENPNVLMPNRSAPRESSFDQYELGCYDLNRTKDLKWFKETYAEEIEHLTKLANNVKIKWGVVSYVS